MPFCSRFQAILVNKSDSTKGLLTRSRCKQWDCSYCARQNKLAWRATIYKYLMDNPDLLWSFHTFTFHFKKNASAYARFIYSVNQIKSKWDTIMKRLKRRYGNFQYVRILEPHKKGGYHIHLMASFIIPDEDIAYRYDKLQDRRTPYLKWIKQDLPNLGFGYIQHSENAMGNGAQTVTYITKYMTKDDEQSYLRLKENRVRYVQTSRGIKSPFNHSGEVETNWKLRHHINFMDFLDVEIFTDLNKKIDIEINDLEGFGGSYPDYDSDHLE